MDSLRVEIQHNTPAQVRDYVAETVRILDDVCGEMEWSQEMFAAVLSQVASKTVRIVEQPRVDLGSLPAGIFNPPRGG